MSDAIEVSWQSQSDPGLGFRVYRSIEGTTFPEDFEEIATVPPDVRLYRDRNGTLDSGYAVTAFNTDGESEELQINTLSPPDPPSALSLKPISGGGVGLSWTLSPTAASKVSGQRVYRTTASSPTFPTDYTQIDSVSDSITSLDDTGASEGQTISYAVTAFNSAGESSETENTVITPIAQARIDNAGTIVRVPVYDPSTIANDWLRIRVNGTIGVLRPISKSGKRLRARSPSDNIVGVKTIQL